MTVSHCMGQALRIAKRPVASWSTEVARLPDGCAHADCTGARSCRQRVGTYLDLQRHLMARLPKARGKR